MSKEIKEKLEKFGRKWKFIKIEPISNSVTEKYSNSVIEFSSLSLAGKKRFSELTDEP